MCAYIRLFNCSLAEESILGGLSKKFFKQNFISNPYEVGIFRKFYYGGILHDTSELKIYVNLCIKANRRFNLSIWDVWTMYVHRSAYLLRRFLSANALWAANVGGRRSRIQPLHML